ncbi:MAG: radical SAM protein [Candidatus Omnitrophota bacterium]
MADPGLIKHTTSVCPSCLKQLRADVVEAEDGIFMQKACTEHGLFRDLVEKDAAFYRAAANIAKERYCGNDLLILPITDRCNMRCKFCFHPTITGSDLPVEKIVETVRRASVPDVALSGGEPTLHPRICEVIRKLKRMGKNVIVVTNGLRLVDPGYAKALKAAGADSFVFSLNGFNDSILSRIDGRPCLEEKLAALENLKREHMRVELSLSILRDVNEGEFKKALEFCLKNPDHVFALRVRSFSRIGRCEDMQGLTTGELMGLLSEALGVGRERLIRAVAARKISSAIQYNAVLYFRYGYGRIDFLTERPLWSSRMTRSMISLAKSMRVGKPVAAVRGALFRKSRVKRLVINMWAVPDRHNFDMGEINSSGFLGVDYGYKMDNFFNAIVLDNTNISSAARQDRCL